MFKQLDDIAENIIALKITGEITRRQTDRISGIIKKRIAKTGTIRLFVIMQHYASMNSAESICEDLRFAKIYSDYIEKMAIVGDKAWKRTWIALFGLFGGIHCEYFDKAEIEMAVNWIRRKK